MRLSAWLCLVWCWVLPGQLELAYGFLTSSAALRTFGSDRVIYLREEASGG